MAKIKKRTNNFQKGEKIKGGGVMNNKKEYLNFQGFFNQVDKCKWTDLQQCINLIEQIEEKDTCMWRLEENTIIYLMLIEGINKLYIVDPRKKVELYTRVVCLFHGAIKSSKKEKLLTTHFNNKHSNKLKKQIFHICTIKKKEYKNLFIQSLQLLECWSRYSCMDIEELNLMNQAVSFFNMSEKLEEYITLNTQLKEYRNQVDKYRQQGMSEMEELLKNTTERYEKTLKKIEDERDRINADRAILQNKYRDLEEEKEQLREVCSANEGIIAQFEQAVRQVQEEVGILKEQNRELREEIKNEIVSNELLEHKEEKSLLEAQEQEKIDEVVQEDQVAPLSVEEREKIMMERIHELEGVLKTNNANYEKALRKIEDERDRINRDKTILQNRYKALEKEKEQLQVICSANEDLIAQLEQSTRQAQEESEALKARNRELEEQRDKLDEVNLTMSNMMEKGDQFQKEAYKKKLAGKLSTPYSEYKDIQEIMDAGYDEDMIADIIEMLLKNLGDVWTTIKASEIQL